MLTDYQAQVNITTTDECWLKIDTSLQVHTILWWVKHFIYLLKNFIRFRHEAASAFIISSLFLFLLSAVSIFLIFTMASKFDSSLELLPLRIAWRNEKGHIDNTWRHVFFYQKGHGATPFYFSLDKTLQFIQVEWANIVYIGTLFIHSGLFKIWFRLVSLYMHSLASNLFTKFLA